MKQDKNKYNTHKHRLVVRFSSKDITCQIGEQVPPPCRLPWPMQWLHACTSLACTRIKRFRAYPICEHRVRL